MDTTTTANHVTASTAGDDGVAMAETHKKPHTEHTLTASQLSEQEPVMPTDAGWYVAVVRCNCEVKIAEHISYDFKSQQRWFDYWVPMQKVAYIDKRTNKRRMKQKVFLSTFIFCHVSKRNLNLIRFRSDVYKMLTMPGEREIYRLSDKEFNDYRAIVENPDLPFNPHNGALKKGQRVRITEGNMKGVEAYVQRISGKKAVIGNEIKYISGATITIDRHFLEIIE